MSGIIIGVDGGGSKTKLSAWNVSLEKIVSETTVEGINACSDTLDVAAARLVKGLRALDVPKKEVLAVSVGDPAIDDSSPLQGIGLLQKIEAAGLFARDTRYYSRSDVFMALYAFTRGAAGALLVAGTGSMGVAFSKPYVHGMENKIETVGGWGEPFPDKGSGYSVAVAGIEAVMDAADGIAPETMLSEAALRFFGVSAVRELTGVFNGGHLKKSEIAAFARLVDECAERGDEQAAEILNRAGRDLGAYALALLNRLPEGCRRLGLYGSVLLHNRRVRAALEERVLSVCPAAEISVPEHPPEMGAIFYASDARKAEREGEKT